MRRLGPYQLVTRLASGTLGDVHLGQVEPPKVSEVISGSVGIAEPETAPAGPPPGTNWAIKVFKEEITSDLRVQRLLTTEGQAALDFLHPNHVRLHEVEWDGRTLYERFDLIGGQTMAIILQKLRVESEPLAHPLVCYVGAQIAGVLHEAHQRSWFPGAPGKLVHGSLAPRRVMVTYDGRPQLVGLGRGRARLTQPLGMATLPYAAFEVLSGKDPTPRSDIYSLGVLLYYAFSGRQIFRRTDEASTRAAVKEANVPTLNSRDLNVDPAIGDLLAQMMAPRVEARPETMSVVQKALMGAAGASEEELREELSEVMLSAFAEEREAFDRMTQAAERVVAPRSSPSVIIAPSSNPAAAPLEEDGAESAPIVRQARPRQEVSRLMEVPKSHWNTEDLQPLDDAPTLTAQEPDTADRITEPDQPAPVRPARRGPGSRKRIARYVVERMITRSDAASLYLCRDPNLARPAMLKVLDPRAVTDPRLQRSDWVQLFKVEARVAARVTHDGFPVLYDAGRDDGAYFMASEYLEGETLVRRMERTQAFEPAVLRRWMIRLAEALHHLHQGGYVHGDVRPSNIMLTDEGLRIIDFSLSSAIEGAQHPLLSSNLVASAPEVLDGRRYTPQSEQFALGTLLYHLLVGVPPFRGIDDAELIAAIRVHDPKPPELMVSGVDATLSQVCMRLLEKEANARFEDMRSVVDRLSAPQPDDVPTHPAPPPPSPVSSVLEHDTDPMMSLPEDGELAPIVMVDPALDHPLGHQLLEGAARRVGLYPNLAAATERLLRAPADRLVVSRDAFTDPEDLERAIASVESAPELRVVAPAAQRLVGPEIDQQELVDALVAICERSTTLATQDFGHRATSDAPAMVRSVTRRLGLSLTAQSTAGLAIALRDLAERLRLSVQSEELQAILPKSLVPLLAAVERVQEGTPSASRLAQAIAIVESYFAATRPRDGRPRTSPRRAVLALRESEDRRYEPEVVQALVEHLREVISALDLTPISPDAPRILVAGVGGNPALLRALEFDGYAIDEAPDGHAAWEKLRRDPYSGAIVDASLPGRDGLSLLKLCRAHPDTSQVAFLILGAETTLDEQLENVAVLDRSAAVENIRHHVGRLLK